MEVFVLRVGHAVLRVGEPRLMQLNCLVVAEAAARLRA